MRWQTSSRLGTRYSDRTPTQTLIDYTVLSANVQMQGYLSTGRAIKSTVVCPKCQRVGVSSVIRGCTQQIVHQGNVRGAVLEATDVCEITIVPIIPETSLTTKLPSEQL